MHSWDWKLQSIMNVFRNARALPLWTAIEIRWNRNGVSRGLEFIVVILLHCLWISRTAHFQGTKVNLWVWLSLMYLLVFDEAALSAAAPALAAVAAMCEWANVIDTVTSYASDLPCDQGINVAPSGHFTCVLDKPIGTFYARIWAFLINATAVYVKKNRNWGFLEKLKKKWYRGFLDAINHFGKSVFSDTFKMLSFCTFSSAQFFMLLFMFLYRATLKAKMPTQGTIWA